MTNSVELVRVGSLEVIERMADRNHADYTHTPFAASLQLGPVTYFWTAA